MSQDHRRRGHTGQKVEEAGTYQCENQTKWSYVRGDVFRECPSTGKSTVWEKTTDPEHPGESR
ncbi:MAG: hypothetical protein ACOY93_14330 [Bacillota bacterium]